MNRIVASAIRVAASLCFTAGAVAFADPALATTSDQARVQVRTADLDLGSPEGHATAQRRIHIAAATVCGVGGFTGATDPACVKSATADASHALQQRTAGSTLLAAR